MKLLMPASNELANELGLVVGKSYALRLADTTGKPWTQDIRITGIWITQISQRHIGLYSSESF